MEPNSPQPSQDGDSSEVLGRLSTEGARAQQWSTLKAAPWTLLESCFFSQHLLFM